MNSVEEKIDQMVQRIVERFEPEQVILFGSHGRGNASADSDVDLLVVVEMDKPRRQKAVDIGLAVQDIDVPKDIVVTSPQDFAWRSGVTGTVEYPAAHEGKVLYARS